MRALVDSDVLIALIDGTEAQSAASLSAMNGAIKGEFEAVVTPLIVANVMYALKRKWRTSKPKTWKADIAFQITRMLGTLQIIPVDDRDFLAAFGSRFKDHEDAVQHFAAVRSRQVDLILTCNVKDFEEFSELPVMEPGEFAKKFLAT